MDLINNLSRYKKITLHHANPIYFQYSADNEICAEFVKLQKNHLTLINEVLGAGYFGIVQKGVLFEEDQNRQLEVAVKLPKSSENFKFVCLKLYCNFLNFKVSLSYKHHHALAAELMVMSKIGSHINVLSILGAIVDGINKEEFCIVFELCGNGSLLDYLQTRRTSFVDQLINTDYETLPQQFAGSQYNRISNQVCQSDIY